MEILTDKNHNAINKCSEYSSCYSCHKENCYIKEIEEKLGELEDVLESWHIENLEELKTRLHDCQVYHLKNNSNETLIHNLKNELDQLKQSQKQLAISELEKLKEKRKYDEKIDTLEQQLKNQPAEIVEKIKEQIFNHFNVKNIEEYERLSLLNALFTADAVAEILDDILKEYQQ